MTGRCFNFHVFFCEHLLLTFWCFLLAIMTSPMTSAMGSRLWGDSQVDQAAKRWKLQYLVEGGAKLLGECENNALFYCNLVWSNVRLGQQVWQVYDPIGFDKVMILIWWLIPHDTCRINLNSGNGLKHWYPPPVKKDKCDSYFGSFINEKKRAILVPRCFWTVPTSPGNPAVVPTRWGT